MHPVCKYCGHEILPGQPHKDCEKALAEIDKAWKEHRQEEEAETQKAYEEEVCPCGHKHDQHYAEEDYCTVRGCDCPQFGEPVENYETHTINKEI